MAGFNIVELRTPINENSGWFNLAAIAAILKDPRISRIFTNNKQLKIASFLAMTTV
jgi:hypothetical protein